MVSMTLDRVVDLVVMAAGSWSAGWYGTRRVRRVLKRMDTSGLRIEDFAKAMEANREFVDLVESSHRRLGELTGRTYPAEITQVIRNPLLAKKP